MNGEQLELLVFETEQPPVDMDLALEVLLVIHPRVPHSQRELAAVCQCSHTHIANIEHRALEKIRPLLVGGDYL